MLIKYRGYMNIKIYQGLYDKNKDLDKLFIDTYGRTDDVVLKNKLELLVELGELANETKVFKYWSKKEPNHTLVLEEYADTLLMVLYFFRELNVSLEEEFIQPKDNDVIHAFIYLFELIAKLDKEYTKELIKEIFVNLLYLGTLLNLSDEEIITSALNKIEIDKKRFEINY